MNSSIFSGYTKYKLYKFSNGKKEKITIDNIWNQETKYLLHIEIFTPNKNLVAICIIPIIGNSKPNESFDLSGLSDFIGYLFKTPPPRANPPTRSFLLNETIYKFTDDNYNSIQIKDNSIISTSSIRVRMKMLICIIQILIIGIRRYVRFIINKKYTATHFKIYTNLHRQITHYNDLMNSFLEFNNIKKDDEFFIKGVMLVSNKDLANHYIYGTSNNEEILKLYNTTDYYNDNLEIDQEFYEMDLSKLLSKYF